MSDPNGYYQPYPYGQQGMVPPPGGQPPYGSPAMIPPPSQPYAPQGMAPPEGQSLYQSVTIDAPTNDSSKNKHGNNEAYEGSKIKFNEKPQYQDVWAAILYIITVICTIVIAGISIPTMNLDNLTSTNSTETNSSATSGSNIGNSGKNGSNTSYNHIKFKRSKDGDSGIDIIIMLLSSVISAGLITFFYVILMQKYAGKMIKGTFILSIIFNLIYALISLLVNPFLGVIMLLFAVLYAFCYFLWRSRIPFAKVMLKTVTSVTRKFPATILTGFIGCFVGAIWYGIIAVTFVAAISSDTMVNLGSGMYVVLIFILFSFYFSTQVINNVVHVTISGVFATYYFRGVVEPGTNKIILDVKNPTVKSFGRAMTTSFGSICFGSLIIAIIQTLRAIANMLKNQANDEDNVILTIIACCIECILSCVQDIVEYFNVYAFTEVAIYGKSYCEAAKDTWEICKARGIEALINDNLIGNVLTLGGLSVGCLSTVVTVAIGFLGLGIKEVSALIIYGILAFLIGMMIFSVVAQVINSGVATTFVCICEDPDALYHTKPELYNKVKETFHGSVNLD